MHCRAMAGSKATSQAYSIIDAEALIDQTTEACLEVQKKREEMMIQRGCQEPNASTGRDFLTRLWQGM